MTVTHTNTHSHRYTYLHSYCTQTYTHRQTNTITACNCHSLRFPSLKSVLGCTIGSTEERSAISPMFCKDQSGTQWCETNLEIYRWLFLGSMYMGTTFSQQGSGGSHPKIWSNTVKTSLRWQEETESNLFPMGQKHLLFLLLTKHISVCLAAISTPALISTDQQHVFALQLSVAVLKLYFFVFLVIVMPC